MNNYPGLPISKMSGSLPGNIVVENIKVDNVLESFTALPDASQFNRSDFTSDVFPNYRITKFLRKGNRLRNHFQGIVRLRDGTHFVTSVGDKTIGRAILVVFKNSSHVKDAGLAIKGPVRSNMIFGKTQGDELVDFHIINKGEPELWHPGGLALLGDIVAVPLENFDDDTTRVDFYSFLDPLKPEKLKISIKCDKPSGENNRFGAVALEKLKDGHYACILYSDPTKKFRIYLSKSTDISQGFHAGKNYTQEIKYNQVINLKRHIGDKAYQSIQTIRDKNDKIYVTVSGNTSGKSPTFNGDNYCALLHLDYDSSNNSSFHLSYQDHLLIDSEDDHSNFDAGFGIYIADKKHIAMYSIYHWRSHKHLKWAEYYGREKSNSSKSDKMADAFVELYSDINYSGSSLILYANEIQSIDNFDDIKVQKDGFENKVQSIRYRLPSGTDYRLYEHKGQRKRQNDNWITLVGDGKVHYIDDLDDVHKHGKTFRYPKKLGGKISSSEL